MALHPVGPLPASTYWRRRAVLAVAVLVLLLVVRSCAGGGGGGTPTAESGSPSAAAPTAVPTAVPTPSATPPPTPASPRAAVPTATRAPVAVTTCPDAALALAAATDQQTYALGATPRLTLSVKNASGATCTRDLGSGAVELLVYSGADRIWSSADCSPSSGTAVTQLAAGAGQTVVRTWGGKRSKPGCSGTAAPAQPGTYRVVARVGTLRVEGAVFQLHA